MTLFFRTPELVKKNWYLYHNDRTWWYHRCVARECIEDSGGWVLQEGPLGIIAQFDNENDRMVCCRANVDRVLVVLPMSESRVWFVIPYTKRKCCLKGALYVGESQDQEEIEIEAAKRGEQEV